MRKTKAKPQAKAKQVLLPITEAGFDAFIKTLVKTYKLPNEEHAAAVVANRIQHLPVDQAYVSLEHLAHCVLKNVAYQVAQSKSRLIQHKMQIEQLEAALKVNPLDQQALDHLEAAIKEGSTYAQEAFDRLHSLKLVPDAPQASSQA